jgi:hypothetical protein
VSVVDSGNPNREIGSKVNVAVGGRLVVKVKLNVIGCVTLIVKVKMNVAGGGEPRQDKQDNQHSPRGEHEITAGAHGVQDGTGTKMLSRVNCIFKFSSIRYGRNRF